MAQSKLSILLTLRDRASKGLKRVGKNLSGVSKSAKSADKATGGLNLRMLALGFASFQAVRKIAALVKESALLAARFETMGVVVDNLGARVGKSSIEMRRLEQSLEDTGISMLGARESIARLISADIDLANATDLARVAQDGAVIAGVNSTAAFEKLVGFISTGNIRVARQIGLFIDLRKTYEDFAEENNRTVASLSELEKTQIRANAVIKAGAQIAGTYEAAMKTAGKQLGSLERDIENFKVTFGQFFTATLAKGVPATRKFVQGITDLLSIQRDLDEAILIGAITFEQFQDAYSDLGGGVKGLGEITEWLSDRVEDQRDVFERIDNTVTDGWLVALRNTSEGTESAGRKVSEARQQWIDFREELAKGIKSKVIVSFDSKSDIAGLAEQYERKLIGGELLADIEQRIRVAISMNADDAEILALLGEGVAAELAVDVLVGDITELEATKTLSEDFKINQGRAKDLIQQWIDKLAGGPSALQGMVEKSILLEESFKGPAGLMSGIIDNFNALKNKTVTITINQVINGGHEGFQHGGSFIVGGRGGVDQNLVAFNATRGERVTITPTGGDTNNDNRIGPINISTEIDGQALIEELKTVVRRS
ncbi:MAG: hypothetical protein QGM45_11370 [Anaerolineales bacterium]|nr:hypothetical protein [Anaerolineales bacterium]